jgi:starch-binding outer membrane protein, SusD/RagB family
MKMELNGHRYRRAMQAGAGALGLLALGACSIQDSLLEQQQPQVIATANVQNAAGANAAYVGALGRLRNSINGGDNNTESIWNFEALMSDEARSADTFSQRNDADSRNTQTFDATLTTIYNKLQLSRGRTRDAITLLNAYMATDKAKIGEMYLAMGFYEQTLGQDFCNSIPLGETVDGLAQYTDPLTNAEVFAQAIQRYDSTLALVTGTDAVSVEIRRAALVAKARTMVNLGQFAAAAALVPASAVPTNFTYLITYSQTTQSNEWWQMYPNVKRYTVGDTTDAINAYSYASSNDPRVKVNKTNTNGFDNTTKYNELLNWGREDPISLVNGLDARLIEAEAQLRLGTVVGWTAMMTILNDLRATPPKYGNFTITAMAALPIPTSQAEAINVFFREKAFWQYGRGERLNDMRRLVRQYGRPVNQVFPSGAYPKGGPYGENVSFPVPDYEKNNPKFAGCTDQMKQA